MNPQTLEKITALIRIISQKSGSHLYKTVWSDMYFTVVSKDLLHEKTFKALPTICKHTLLKTPFSERTYTHNDHIHAIRGTSGTTGGDPLLFPINTARTNIRRRIYQNGARVLLHVWAYDHFTHTILFEHESGIQNLMGDSRDLPNTAKLIAQAGIDSLFICPSVLLLLHSHLETHNATKHITHIILGGESFSNATLKKIKALFPSIRMYFCYALSELGSSCSYRTPECSVQDSNYYHIEESDIYAESIGGELVLTTLNPNTAMPLIRYRTGDQVDFIENDSCTCGHTGTSFRVQGRHNVDFVRVAGVEVHYNAIESIIEQFSDSLSPYLSVTIQEQETKGSNQFTMTLSVVLQKETTNQALLTVGIQHALREQLQLSPTLTLKQAIAQDFFTTPVINFLNTAPSGNKRLGIKFTSL